MRLRLLGILCLFIPILTFAQTKFPLKGTVLGEDGKPLAHVSVKEVGTSNGTITDVDGHFALTVASGSATLEFTYIGYTKQKVKVNNNSSLSIAMKTDASGSNLKDVVVVGVQAQSRRTTTASISSVSGKSIENMPAPSFDQLLQGRVPGLDVQVTSGEPGVAPTMVVRGNSRLNQNISGIDQAHALSGPLYVIDGVPVNPEDVTSLGDATGTNFLAGISVNDIESIDVQKDAAATAAWGSRGANGVIYVKTRKGRTLRPEFRVNVYGGVIQEPELMPTVTGSAERTQKLQLLDAYGSYANLQNLPQMLTDSLNPYFNNATDWQGMFYRNAAVKNTDLTIAAANDIMNYRVSMNYYNEQGTMKGFGFERYSARGNFDFKISKKFNAQFLVSGSHSDRQRGDKLNNTDNNTPFGINSGNMPSSFFGMNATDSANYLGINTQLRNSNTNDWYMGSLTLNYDVIPGLRLTSQASANITYANKDYFMPGSSTTVGNLIGATQSYAESDASTYADYYISNSATYFKTLNTGDHTHHLTLTALQTYDQDMSKYTTVSGYDGPSNYVQTVTGISQQNLSGNSDYQASAILSFMGQAQYDFDSKYILYAGDRTDGSSRFGTATKWGNFPSGGIGWIASDEKFLKGIKDYVSLLKFRGSYGMSGQNSQYYYAPFNSYVTNGTYDGQTAVGPSYTNGLTKTNLTWSRTYQKDLGIEVQALNERIYFAADIYDKTTKGDYYNFNLPFYTGYSQVYFNANDLWVDNRGLELTATVHLFPQHNKFQWNSTLNIAFNKNTIAKLPNGDVSYTQSDYYGVNHLYAVGQPTYEFFQMKYAGVYNSISQMPVNPLTGQRLTYFKGNYPGQPGYPIWIDANHDYDVWSGENNGDVNGDQVPSGNPNPKYTGGWVNDFSYKNFSLSILCIFSGHRDIVNMYKESELDNVFSFPSGNYSNTANAMAANMLPNLSGFNYWTPGKAAENPNYQAAYPALNAYGANFYQFLPFSTMFNENGAYFKVKNLTLGYRLNDHFVRKIKLTQVRFYGMIENLLTITKSTVPDPELVNELGIYTGGQFPVPHKLTLGMDITF